MKRLENPNNFLLLSVIFLMALFLFLLLRNTGLYPSIFADEYTYSKLSRLLPLSDSPIPGYLYLKLYSITNYCGNGYLGCAKIINAVVFVSSAPFIFLIARRVASKSVSAYVTLLAVIGPINSYTAYFMPESFYFLSFWVACWYLLTLDFRSGNYRWFAAGAIFAVSSLIKPHSILYLPAILLYIAFVFYRAQSLFSKAFGMAIASLLFGAVITKFGISYMLAGPSGLTVFGSFYWLKVSSASSEVDKYIQLLQLAFENLKGHLLVVALIYGLPLTISFIFIFNRLFSKTILGGHQKTNVDQFEKITVLSLIILFNLICVVALFTAIVANSGYYETPYRLHMRYYNFALPLFYIVAAGAFSTTIKINKLFRYLVGIIVAILGIYSVWSNLRPFTPNYIDSPEIYGLYVDNLYFQVVSGLLIFALALWIVFQRKGLQLYFYIALPLFVIVSTYHLGLELKNHLKQNVYDKAGIFAKQYLPNDAIANVVIIGSELGNLYRSLYYLDNAQASLKIIQRDADYDLTTLATTKNWALVIGNHKILGRPFYQIPMNGFTLIRASKDNVIDFKKGGWPGIIFKVRGLSIPESWGTWSISDIVVFEFAVPLPKRFEMHLVAHAFGPNVGSKFVASVGQSTTTFTLSAKDETKIIRLENPTGSNMLSLKIPHAVSPKALGLSGEKRNLGIGFVEIKIVDLQ